MHWLFLFFSHLSKLCSAVENKNLCITFDTSSLSNLLATLSKCILYLTTFHIFHCYYFVQASILSCLGFCSSLLTSLSEFALAPLQSPPCRNQSDSSNSQMWSRHPLHQNPQWLPVTFRIKLLIQAWLTSAQRSCICVLLWSHLFSHYPLFIDVQHNGFFFLFPFFFFFFAVLKHARQTCISKHYFPFVLPGMFFTQWP